MSVPMHWPCPRCRKQVLQAARFCPRCGLSLHTVPVATLAGAPSSQAMPSQVLQASAPSRVNPLGYQPIGFGPRGRATLPRPTLRKKKIAGSWWMIGFVALIVGRGVSTFNDTKRSAPRPIVPNFVPPAPMAMPRFTPPTFTPPTFTPPTFKPPTLTPPTLTPPPPPPAPPIYTTPHVRGTYVPDSRVRVYSPAAGRSRYESVRMHDSSEPGHSPQR